MYRSSLAAVVLLLSADALAGPIKVASVTASSEYPAEGGVSYTARQVVDGKAGTSWVEGEQGSGLGSWVQLDLGGDKSVQRIKIWHGMWYSYDYFTRGNRPKEVEIKFSDDSTETFPLTDEMVVQDIKLPSPKTTSSIRIRVKQIYNGTTWLDTAISEVQVFDTGGDTDVPVKGFASSSMLPADNDGNYEPRNMNDGLVDSMWCEGNKDGDGTQEWVEFDFGGSKPVSHLTLVNGVGSSIKTWMDANRVTTARLTFSDGSSTDIEIKNTVMPQTVSFPSTSTSKVRLTVTGVMKGKQFNDLCLSEARFSK